MFPQSMSLKLRKSVHKIQHLFESNRNLLVTDPAYQLASLKHAPEMADLIWEVKEAFKKEILPIACDTHNPSSFFLRDCEGRAIAIFKTENYWREIAAYRLDHRHFASVPPTVITTLEHPSWGKFTGSCQLLISETVEAVTLNRLSFQEISAPGIRRMASLDIRVMNSDRHTSNILINEQKEPIPIDHGYILPGQLKGLHFVWLDWSQSATLFNDHELTYISLLDPEEDRSMLIDELQIEEKRANRFFVASIFLKIGAGRGLTARDIGNLMVCPTKEQNSSFETIFQKINQKSQSNWNLYSNNAYNEIEKFLDGHEKATH